MARLEVQIGDLQLRNPVMTASGTFGYGTEYSDFIDLGRLGGVFVKGTTLEPREGNDYPRMAPVCSIQWDFRTRVLIISWSISIRS
jgi:dihydroorotate dehydrogenase (NAD+) catalytic subunit